MASYSVYLEIGSGGTCMAHVVDLPGCVVRALTREEALCLLPAAISDYHDWLRRHGEVAPSDGETVEFDVVGESTGCGPFDPGDAAALFPPDREPISLEEMERYCRLMGYNRVDLLALARDLPEEMLDWRPDADSYNLRRVLRHVGNGDEWYVSRIVPPETLPPEWEDDEDMPLFEFLEMARRTAVDRLRQLGEEERVGVFYPTVRTSHPEEPWTARKVLRRFLEHEREHTVQVRQILSAYRRWLLARLASERARLLEQVLGLDERLLTKVPVVGDWAVKDVLAHIAGWDRWEDRTMRCMVAGDRPDFASVEDLDASNAAIVAAWRERSLTEVVAEFKTVRRDWVAWLQDLPLEEFFGARSCGGDDWSFYSDPLRVQWQHDAGHADEIAAWRKTEGLQGVAGPLAILSAALDAARVELLAAASCVPAEVQDSRPVCGDWTLKDLLGHIADWELFGARGLAQMAAGQAPRVEHIDDFDAWNASHVDARRDQPWERVWDDLHGARRALSAALEEVGEAGLGQKFPFPWGPEGTPYEWVGVFLGHDREHARDVQMSVGLVSSSEGSR